MKDGERVELIKNCPDNPYIKKGMQGIIWNDFISYDGHITIQFDTDICGTHIVRDKYNTWNIKPEFLKVIQDQKFTCEYCGKEIETDKLKRNGHCYCAECFVFDNVE